MRLLSIVVLAAAIGGLPACAKKSVQSAPVAASAVGEQSKAGAFLAYEHTVRVELHEDDIAKRIDAVREACASERFGSCSLLSLKQDSGRYPSGEVAVRVAPAAVEPLVKLAAEGAEVRARETSAEDLAQAVGDNARQRELLTRQRARLEELQARKDLATADVLALSRELASLEVQFDAVEQESAQQRRRIETNRLTIHFSVATADSDDSRIVGAFRNLGQSLGEGTADAIEYLGYVLPFLVLGFPLLLMLRWIWRRATRRRG